MRPTHNRQNRRIKLLNPIPQENLDECNSVLFINNVPIIDQFKKFLLENKNFNPQQWIYACNIMECITNILRESILQTCSTLPIPTLSPIKLHNKAITFKKIAKTMDKTYHYLPHHQKSYKHYQIQSTMEIPSMHIKYIINI